MPEQRNDSARVPLPGELISYLPPRIWYLTSNGNDMWCRRPYTFFFSSDEAARAFAEASGVGEQLSPIGLDSQHLLGEEVMGMLQAMDVTRIFVDPEIDPATGDVHGAILRLEGHN
ncbi:MAG TPA: hypothetical protein VHE35_01550 [Kofleriaceae bacterium]|nr:hypothetical protein [Kofleriaceae bacterium]